MTREPVPRGQELRARPRLVPLYFDDCALDLDTRELWRSGRRVAVPPEAFDLLELLVRERSRRPHPAEPLQTVSGPVARWRLLAGERAFILPQGETLVGRGVDCGARIESAEVSRVHARVVVDGATITLEDCGSRNGTWVNSIRLENPVRLNEGDRVHLGVYKIDFRRSYR